jgi:hypothetical protein
LPGFSEMLEIARQVNDPEFGFLNGGGNLKIAIAVSNIAEIRSCQFMDTAERNTKLCKLVSVERKTGRNK